MIMIIIAVNEDRPGDFLPALTRVRKSNPLSYHDNATSLYVFVSLLLFVNFFSHFFGLEWFGFFFFPIFLLLLICLFLRVSSNLRICYIHDCPEFGLNCFSLYGHKGKKLSFSSHYLHPFPFTLTTLSAWVYIVKLGKNLKYGINRHTHNFQNNG